MLFSPKNVRGATMILFSTVITRMVPTHGKKHFTVTIRFRNSKNRLLPFIVGFREKPMK